MSDIEGEWVKSELEPSCEFLRRWTMWVEDGREWDAGVADWGESRGEGVSSGEIDGDRVTSGVMAGVKFGERAGDE